MLSLHECLICGEQFAKDLLTCPGCGANKNSVREINSINSSSGKILETTNKEEVKFVAKSSKSFSTIKLIYFCIALVFIGTTILYSSGIFETPTVALNSNANPHAGASLKNLEEINQLEAAIKNNPEDYDSVLNLAHLLNDGGLKEKAIERYNDYLKKFPNVPDVLVDLGVCYYELGKNQNAIMYMNRALEINPKHQIANLNIGVVNFSMGKIDLAKQFWKKAVSIDPTTEIAKRAQELINQH